MSRLDLEELSLESIEKYLEKNSSDLSIAFETYKRIVKISFEQTLVDLQALKESFGAKDLESIKIIAHKLRGVFLNLRMDNVSEPLVHIHDLAVAGIFDENMLSAYEDFIKSFKALEKFILK